MIRNLFLLSVILLLASCAKEEGDFADGAQSMFQETGGFELLFKKEAPQDIASDLEMESVSFEPGESFFKQMELDGDAFKIDGVAEQSGDQEFELDLSIETGKEMIDGVLRSGVTDDGSASTKYEGRVTLRPGETTRIDIPGQSQPLLVTLRSTEKK